MGIVLDRLVDEPEKRAKIRMFFNILFLVLFIGMFVYLRLEYNRCEDYIRREKSKIDQSKYEGLGNYSGNNLTINWNESGDSGISVINKDICRMNFSEFRRQLEQEYKNKCY